MNDMDKLIKRCTDRQGRIDKQMLHARGVLTDNSLFDPEDANPDSLGGAPLVEAKGLSARGELSGRPYWVAVFWGGELGDQVQIRGWDADWVTEELASRKGQEFPFAHPGPDYELKLDNALSILTALMAIRGRDFEWKGDKPPGYPRFNRREPVEH